MSRNVGPAAAGGVSVRASRSSESLLTSIFHSRHVASPAAEALMAIRAVWDLSNFGSCVAFPELKRAGGVREFLPEFGFAANRYFDGRARIHVFRNVVWHIKDTESADQGVKSDRARADQDKPVAAKEPA